MFCVLLSFGFFHGTAKAKGYDILFIGNSFTGNHNMPKMLAHLVDSAGLHANVASYILLGRSVNEYIKDPKCWEVIRSNPWDYIIIQDNQLYYSDSVGKLDSFGSHLPVLANNIKFQDSIKKLIPCVKIIYFAGWEQDGGFPSRFPNDSTPALIDRIMANYQYLNKQPGVNNTVAPIGAAWKTGMRGAPFMMAKPFTGGFFYEKDGRHPGWSGSYMAACVLYVMMYHQPPEGIRKAPDASKISLISYIQDISWNTVLDNFEFTNLQASIPLIGSQSNLLSIPNKYASYQWYASGKAIPGATKSDYRAPSTSIPYSVYVVNKKGCVSSSFPIRLKDKQ